MWSSCILEVSSAGTPKIKSENFSICFLFGHFCFVKIIDFIFFFFANFNALITFRLFPEVVIPIAISPGFPIDSICLEKISLNEKSFPIAVNAEVSVDKDIAGIDLLFFYILQLIL